MSTPPSPTGEPSQRTSHGTPRGRRRERFAAAVSLCRARLGRTRLARVGLGSGVLLGASFVVFAIVLRAAEGAGAPLEGLVVLGGSAISTVAAAPTALAAAGDRRAVDREAGFEALAATRGVHARSLDTARSLAAMLQISRAIAIPLVGLALVTAALASSGGVALRRLALAIGLLTFSAIAGVTLGAVAALSARFGGRRGRVLFAAIILVPWVFAELAGRGTFSIPGALSAVLSLVVDAFRGGATA